MDNSKNNLAITLIAIGLVLLIQKFLNFSILNIALWLILGISLLLLYKNKNEKWAMPLGVISTYWGISKILTKLDIISYFASLSGLLWFVSAFILIILYFRKKKLYLFNIGIILLSFGVNIFATSYKLSYIFISFNISMTVGLFLGYIFSNRKSKLNLYFGIFYLFLVLKSLIFDNSLISVPIIFIIAGLIVYFENKLSKKYKNDNIIDKTNDSQINNKNFNEFNN